MNLPKCSWKDLKKLLEDFAHDLVNHCLTVENEEIVMRKKGLKNLIELYVEGEKPYEAESN